MSVMNTGPTTSIGWVKIRERFVDVQIHISIVEMWSKSLNQALLIYLQVGIFKQKFWILSNFLNLHRLCKMPVVRSDDK